MRCAPKMQQAISPTLWERSIDAPVRHRAARHQRPQRRRAAAALKEPNALPFWAMEAWLRGPFSDPTTAHVMKPTDVPKPTEAKHRKTINLRCRHAICLALITSNETS